jgi:hypothetical protein
MNIAYAIGGVLVIASIIGYVWFKKTWIQDFNYTHPELRQGEVFLGNFDDPAEKDIFLEEEDNTTVYDIGWKTKRIGIKAYSIEGVILEHSVPVFVQATELQAENINTKKLWPRFVRK